MNTTPEPSSAAALDPDEDLYALGICTDTDNPPSDEQECWNCDGRGCAACLPYF